MRAPKSQSCWYGIHLAEPKDPTRPGKSVNTWPNDAAEINSAFSRICKATASASHPSSRPISQDNLFIVDHCFCPKCSQSPQCCTCSASGRLSPKLLADVVPPGCKSKGSVNFERRLHSPIQNKTPTSKRPIDNQWLCKPPQEPLPEGGFACIDQQEGSREGKGSDLPSLLQQIVHCPQTKPEMAANLGPQCSKPIFECKNIQNGDPRNNLSILATKGMGDIAGFQRRLFPHTSTHLVLKVPPISLPEPIIPLSGPFPWPINSSYGVYLYSQRGQVNGSVPGYKNPPVPR